jgi:hypothetical protein
MQLPSLPLGALLRENKMQRFDRNFILVGLGWVIVGMIFGTWLGATDQMNYANSHAHANLLGFVTSVLFGLLHWAYPALGSSKVAFWQFVLYETGVLILVVGKVLVDGGTQTALLPIGAIITIIGAALMLYMFARQTAARV